MSETVCLAANTIGYPEGGHVWGYLDRAARAARTGLSVLLEELCDALRLLADPLELGAA